MAVAGLAAGPVRGLRCEREHHQIDGCSRSSLRSPTARSADGHPRRAFRIRVRLCFSVRSVSIRDDRERSRGRCALRPLRVEANALRAVATEPRGIINVTAHDGSALHPQLLGHRPHRPRQVDAGRPLPRDHRRAAGARDGSAGARRDGPRARARHHDQGAPGPAELHGGRRRDSTSST